MMTNSTNKKTAKAPGARTQKARPRPRRAGERELGRELPFILLRTFGCGVGSALVLLAAFAVLLEKAPIPLTMVRPFVCVAAAVGAAVSGVVLAGGIGQKKLLCGLGCGMFYALCLLAASALTGPVALAGDNLSLLAALLAGGMLGGAISAVRAPGAATVR